MGGRWSQRKKGNNRNISVAGGGAAFTQPSSLKDSLLSKYKQGLDPEEVDLQFEGGSQLKRFWICKSLVEKDIFVNIFSYLCGRELMTCIEINKTWFYCADTAWLWDAVDGIYGMGDVSMGRYDYRCRHHRMRLTREEKRRHRAHIAGMEFEEEKEKRYCGDKKILIKKEIVDKTKRGAIIIAKRGKKKALSCVVNMKRSVSIDEADARFQSEKDGEERLL
jgi:hypothetical protein